LYNYIILVYTKTSRLKYYILHLDCNFVNENYFFNYQISNINYLLLHFTNKL